MRNIWNFFAICMSVCLTKSLSSASLSNILQFTIVDCASDDYDSVFEMVESSKLEKKDGMAGQIRHGYICWWMNMEMYFEIDIYGIFVSLVLYFKAMAFAGNEIRHADALYIIGQMLPCS